MYLWSVIENGWMYKLHVCGRGRGTKRGFMQRREKGKEMATEGERVRESERGRREREGRARGGGEKEDGNMRGIDIVLS